MATIEKYIDIKTESSDPGSSSPINISSFYFSINDSKSIIVHWNVVNATKIELKITKGIYSSTYREVVVQNENSILLVDVTNISSQRGYQIAYDPKLSIQLELIASNSSESKTSEKLFINPSGTDYPVSLIYSKDGFQIQREEDSFNKVKGKVSLVYSEFFNKDLINGNILLLYRNDGSSSWSFIDLGNKENLKNIYSGNGLLSSYELVFNKLTINVPSSATVIYFKIKVPVKDSGDNYTEELSLFFDFIDPSNATSPNDTVLDLLVNQKKPTQLRYEIKAIVSEGYYRAQNIKTYNDDSSTTNLENSFGHRFLDTDQFKGRSYAELMVLKNYKNSFFNGFYYEDFDGGENLNNYRGYYYPACVSEILPCINILKNAAGTTTDIILFWKIIDGFYNYSFLENAINIATKKLEVSVQYFDGSSYQVIKSKVELKNNIDYNEQENKFVLKLKRSEIENSLLTLFDKISIVDNKTNYLKVVVEKHEVTCKSPLREIDYSFDKLLLPPSWNYIVYDEFISDSLKDNAGGTINIKLNNYILRGIQIPDRGFKIYDTIKNFTFYSSDSTGTKQSSQDIDIFYKLTFKVNAFYLDPVLTGTLTYIDLPFKPDDVFLIPPTVSLPPPNIDPLGRQAEAEVELDENGKIKGIVITDPGYGYSMFKTESDKRKQTFVDLVPIVKSTYKIVSQNRNINKKTLSPVNSSLSNLRASLKGGKLLTSIGQNDAVLNEEQKKILEDYLSRNNIFEESINDQVPAENSAVYPYINKNSKKQDSTSIQNLDPSWFEISKLYSDKNISVADNFSIYNEDVDLAVTENEDSALNSTISASNNSLEVVSTEILSQNSSSTTAYGKTFALNNLLIYTDASPSYSIIDNKDAPPWLTLMPLNNRPDASPAYGVLPNMLPRASSFFNRLVVAINHLNEVRLILPTVWAVNRTDYGNSYYDKQVPTNDFEIINFSTNGIKVPFSSSYSYYIPSNSGFSVSASRSVGKVYLKSSEIPWDIAKNGESPLGTYVVSSENGSSISFSAMIHPWAANVLEYIYGSNISKKYLGIQTKTVNGCSSESAYQENGLSYIICPGVFGDYARYIPAGISLPASTSSTSPAQFTFLSAGSISESPQGSASALMIPNGRTNSVRLFCSRSCGDSSTTALDFRYSNLYPLTVQI